MGLFGDKAGKLLDRKLESGWAALGVGAKTGRLEQTADNVTAEVLAAARGLTEQGRSADALARLQRAHRKGDDALTHVWNGVLDDVLTNL